MRSTHTYVTLPVSRAVHNEVRGKLLEVGYDHAIDGEEINMHGLALIPDDASVDEAHLQSFRHLYTNDPIIGGAIDLFLAHFPDSELSAPLRAKLSGKAPVNEG